MAVPDFDQFVEYVTEGPVIRAVALTQHSLDVLSTLEAVKSGYEHVAALGRAADLTPAESTALKAQLAALAYHSDMVRYATDDTSAPGEIVTALVEVKQRPDWLPGLAAQVGGVYGFEGNLYECVQAHTTQSDWTPVVAKALFKRFYEPTDDPWPFVQPTGAHDSYPKGARVTHGGYTWESLIDANVWGPGSAGTESLWKNLTPPPPTSAWAANTNYAIGNEVTYGGFTYRCRQAHTSIVTWEPPNVPALWLKL